MSATEGLTVEDWQRIAAAKDEALDAIGRERNTWARQMADLRDELDAARDDRDKAWEAKAEAQNESAPEADLDIAVGIIDGIRHALAENRGARAKAEAVAFCGEAARLIQEREWRQLRARAADGGNVPVATIIAQSHAGGRPIRWERSDE